MHKVWGVFWQNVDLVYLTEDLFTWHGRRHYYNYIIDAVLHWIVPVTLATVPVCAIPMSQDSDTFFHHDMAYCETSRLKTGYIWKVLFHLLSKATDRCINYWSYSHSCWFKKRIFSYHATGVQLCFFVCFFNWRKAWSVVMIVWKKFTASKRMLMQMWWSIWINNRAADSYVACRQTASSEKVQRFSFAWLVSLARRSKTLNICSKRWEELGYINQLDSLLCVFVE